MAKVQSLVSTKIGNLKTLSWNSKHFRHAGRNALIYIVFLFQSFVVIYPIFIMIISSFKSNLEIYKNPNGPPQNIYLQGYVKAFVRGTFLIYFRNSIFVTLCTIVIVLLVASLAAYALGRYKFRGNSTLYFFFLAGIIIPIRLGVLNLFEVVRALGLYNNLLALILIYSAMGVPMAMFILVPLIRQIPQDLVDAAEMDGCSGWGLFQHIVIPLIRPSLGTVAILTFLPAWNDFFFPLVFIKTNEMMTLPLGVATLFGQFSQDLNTAFSVLTIASLPPILFYLLASRQFIKGIMAGSLKG